MTAPWTPRERALYKALEASHLWWRHDLSCQDGLKAQCKCQSCIDKWVAGLLADPPPPDPRDEALRLAEEAIAHSLTFVETCNVTYVGAEPEYEAARERQNEARTYVYKGGLKDALAAIRATKGER